MNNNLRYSFLKIKKNIFFILLLFFIVELYCQEKDSVWVDKNYKEDQFYFGLYYITFQNKSSRFSPKRLSYGLSIGHIRDLPINSRRNIGFGIGLGYSYYLYTSNLGIVANRNGFQYTYTNITNNISLHNIEVPIEFRWRTSTPKNYAFWRIYVGTKFQYTFLYNYILIRENSQVKNDINNWATTIYINLGHNTVNFSIAYSITSFFKKNVIDIEGSSILINPLSIGIIFFIL